MRLFNNYLQTMKKIKSSKQLLNEKKRLQQQQDVLENKMREQWSELKVSLRPVNIAKETLQEVIDKKEQANKNDESVLKSTINYGMNLLMKKLTDKAGLKLGKIFK
jgi:hypothetical protein